MTQNLSGRFKQFYTEESKRYHASRYGTRYGDLFHRLHLHVIEELLDRLPRQSRILEVACGTGHVTSLLAGKGFPFVACDLTPAMMVQSRQRCNGKGAFVEADAFRLPFPDSVFEGVLSTRFLHLFPHPEQQRLLTEMLRVLKKDGLLIVDFDNAFSRWFLSVAYAAYNIIRYRRLAPYAIYNSIRPTEKMFRELGLSEVKSIGIGGTHLILPAWFSGRLAFALGLSHRSGPLRLFAEQFVVTGTKKL